MKIQFKNYWNKSVIIYQILDLTLKLKLSNQQHYFTIDSLIKQMFYLNFWQTAWKKRIMFNSENQL